MGREYPRKTNPRLTRGTTKMIGLKEEGNRRIFYIDVEDMSVEKLKAYLIVIKDQMEKKNDIT